jgi:hypothetical protein
MWVPMCKVALNTTQYYVYDYQGKRVRTVIESNHQVQSQRDYLPALDLSINQNGSATIGIIMFVAEDLNFVIQFQDVGL